MTYHIWTLLTLRWVELWSLERLRVRGRWLTTGRACSESALSMRSSPGSPGLASVSGPLAMCATLSSVLELRRWLIVRIAMRWPTATACVTCLLAFRSCVAFFVRVLFGAWDSKWQRSRCGKRWMPSNVCGGKNRRKSSFFFDT